MKVLQFGESALRQSCKPLVKREIFLSETKDCASQLISIMKGLKEISPNNGNGLAAPQIGKSIRLIVVYFDSQFNQMFNPEILQKSVDAFDATEGCLSFFYLRAQVERYQKITVSFEDQFGNKLKKTFEDNLAGLVQHEIDHLDGILFIDHIRDMKKLSSIDYLLENNQERLRQVKKMIEYVLN